MPENNRYSWFSRKRTSDNVLEQGTIILKFPFIDLSAASYNELANDVPLPVQLSVRKVDVIIMTQSCDLAADKVRYITLAPVYSLRSQVEKAENSEAKRSLIANLKKGALTNSFLLNKCELTSFGSQYNDFLVVKFDEAFTVPKELVEQAFRAVSYCMQLNLPYRESLAQAFGIFYMRIGNPVNYASVLPSDYSGD